ncbi:MAG: choice-of-anchor B family protein [Planctomycetes bacterium]|nr:choice-of-anchor B family protein [Planctomycetota bacterium]
MLHRGWVFTVAALALTTLAFAHDGDGKLRDRRPAYAGHGFTRARATNLGGAEKAMNLLGFQANGVQLMSWLPLADLKNGASSANSCWGHVSGSGREYAIIGVSNATVFVEITNPGAAQVVAAITGPTSLWRDVKSYGNYCYAASEGGSGIQVMDMSQIDSGIVTLVNTVTSGGDQATHTLAVDQTSGFLYRAGGNGNGLRVYSLANPANPTFVGQWQTKYVHEASVYTYTSGTYAGKQIAFCCGGYNNGWNSTGLDILDVTNKSNITVLGHISYSGAQYCHQGWLSDDKQYFYIDDEFDEGGAGFTKTYVIKVTNLSAPQHVNTFVNSSTAIGHNLYVRGNRLYAANYTSGLRVFDKTNQTSPTEIAYFDTWPDNDDNTFNGLWNNYPFFPSNVVIGSDIEKGLFVWWIGAPQLAVTFPNGYPTQVDPNGETVRVQIAPASGSSVQAGSEKLFYDVGQGWQSTPLVALGGNQYDALLPAGPCGTALRWYVGARSQNGWDWIEPQAGTIAPLSSVYAAALNVVATDAFETASGWTAGDPSDTATDGAWVRMDPYGTTAQADSDHTLTGTLCWVTGATPPHGGANQGDVDGGTTTLTSPAYDLAALAEPALSYWRWFHNSAGTFGNEDTLTVQISNDDGASWTTVETVGPTGPETSGNWYQHVVRVADFVAPTSTVRLRFVADDSQNDSLVEAGVDDVEVLDLQCPGTPQYYCVAKTNSQGCAPAISGSGFASASSAQSFVIGANDVLNQKFGLLFYGSTQASLAFQGGTLCVALPITRTSVQASGGSASGTDCSGSYAFDLNAWIQSGNDPSLVAGAQVCCQYWARDPQDPAGFATSLSNALKVVIEP